MKALAIVILISSLLTNIVLGFIAYTAYHTQIAIQVPLEGLTKATDALTLELRTFTLDEIKKSYTDTNGYIHVKTEELKEKTDEALTKTEAAMKKYFTSPNVTKSNDPHQE